MFAQSYQEGTSIYIRNRRLLAVSLCVLCSSALFIALFYPIPELMKAVSFGLGLVGMILGLMMFSKAVADGYVRVRQGAVELLMTRRWFVTARWAISDIIDVKFDSARLSIMFTVARQRSFWDMFKWLSVPESSADEAAGMVAYLEKCAGLKDKTQRDTRIRREMKESLGGESLFTRALADAPSKEQREE